jgi:hypothetical protein
MSHNEFISHIRPRKYGQILAGIHALLRNQSAAIFNDQPNLKLLKQLTYCDIFQMIVKIPELLVQVFIAYQCYSTLWQVVGSKAEG